MPKKPVGAATDTKEQQLDPLTRLLVTEVTNDSELQGPTGTHTEDPEILPHKVTTPEGDVTELSQDFTLSEEGKGDILSGNKEL